MSEVETSQERIARVQRGLAAAKAFHADYLARRQARGVRTATDTLTKVIALISIEKHPIGRPRKQTKEQ